ncbi:baculoviral IAP repeat-containing protein 7-B-like [Crassostrea angulata]|uniref:baculoviral IAP repeat-containing protein 7-B-like n=1 Tax=Magallana angulata TaxID=2784310 RepID=UPI0022B0C17C|nr:baculoviral IAP repeat-containing protein 7-B-like [Crassostrea angulata]
MSFILSFLLLVIDLSEDLKAPLHVNHTRSKTVTLDPQREQGQRGQDWVKLENQRLWEERRCKICGGGETAVLFDPCGHMCACVDCSAVQRHCPLCSQFISHHHRVFRA